MILFKSIGRETVLTCFWGGHEPPGCAQNIAQHLILMGDWCDLFATDDEKRRVRFEATNECYRKRFKYASQHFALRGLLYPLDTGRLMGDPVKFRIDIRQNGMS